MMKRVATLTTILLLCMSLYAHAATVTELLGLAGVGGTTGGGCTSTGSGDCISNSFTPTAGDTVVLAIAFQNTSTYPLPPVATLGIARQLRALSLVSSYAGPSACHLVPKLLPRAGFCITASIML